MRSRLAILGFALLLAAGGAWAADNYADGSKINLCSIRGDIATNSSGNASASQPLRPVGYLDSRFQNDTGGSAWWQIQFPGTYKVGSYYFQTYSNLYDSMSYQVQTSLTGTPGSWVDRTGVISLVGAPKIPATLSGTFTGGPVDAKYVRLNTLSYAGYSDMIVAVADLSGPNNPPVNPSISLAQSPWAGGSATMVDRLRGSLSGVDTAPLNDDFPTTYLYGIPYYPDLLNPTQMTVTLNDKYLVDTVGLTTISDNRKARDLDIWISPDASGSSWTKVKSVTDLTQSVTYHEIGLDGVYSARRVRFDILSAWSGVGGQGYMAQLYVYGSVPEPATLALLALGGTILLRRRR